MDERPGTETALIEETSQQYLGRWNRLISTTNWEKGRIILEWREALIASGAPATEYSDEAWSRRVGNVTPQHVGRLRRVAELFGAVRDDYPGIYWSHFQAALDWHDAEMWLEGAVQNGWSVAQMRNQRWEALGAPDDDRPRDEDVVTSELDEDYTPTEMVAFGEPETVRGPRDDEDERSDFNRERSGRAEYESGSPSDEPPFDADGPARQTPPEVRPFANLAELPEDLSEAFEAFKLAILRHKLADWAEVPRDDVLAALDSLRQLALAPRDDE